MIGDLVANLLAERGGNLGDFYRGLERGLAQSKCHRCEYTLDRDGCHVYGACRHGDTGRTALFRERSF